MDAALCLGLGHPLYTVHATLVLQLRVRPLAVNLELDPVEAAFLARPGVDDLGLPALLLRPPLVHAEEVGRKEGSLLPTLGPLDLDDDVTFVSGVLGQEQELQPIATLPCLRRSPPLLRAQVLLHLWILLMLEHLPRRLSLVQGSPVLLISRDQVAQAALLPRELGQLVVVRSDLRLRHLRLDLLVTLRDALEPIYHAAPIVWPGFARPPPPNVIGMAGIVGGSP